jgi:hypothetical protein
MGVASFKGAIVRQRDVSVEKNYLNKDELDELNRIMRMWSDQEDMQNPDQIPDFELSARGFSDLSSVRRGYGSISTLFHYKNIKSNLLYLN